MLMSSLVFANEIGYNELTQSQIEEYTLSEGYVTPRVAVKWYTTIKNAGSVIVVRTDSDVNYLLNRYVYISERGVACGDKMVRYLFNII